ncbi:hypothetical protein [Vibrio sp. Hal054]|uniref:hypothetical protein n=1 Tax=Vibrio sp. Hal054 TaxID=3035158 RepID=UPI00301BB68D
MLSTHIQADGNDLVIGSLRVVVFDATGSHGAENALAAMTHQQRDLSTNEAALNSLKQLCRDTRGQYQVMSQEVIA